jgi:hypothetical protein
MAAALAFLKDPKLTQRVGLVCEPSNALVSYLACISRKLASPLAVLIQSTSTAGKSTLMYSVLALVPEEDRVHYSAMTGQSLFYTIWVSRRSSTDSTLGDRRIGFRPVSTSGPPTSLSSASFASLFIPRPPADAAPFNTRMNARVAPRSPPTRCPQGLPL